MARIPSVGLKPDESVGIVETAQTFSESDVTLGTTDTEVSAESIRLAGTTVSRSGDDQTESASGFYGLVINPNQSISALQFDVSSNTSGATRGAVLDTNGNQLGDSPVALDNGTARVGGLSLSSGTKYYAVVDANGSGYTSGKEGNTSYPYTGGPLDIVASYYGSETTSSILAVNAVGPTPGSGTVTVGWPEPDDIFSWDRLAYTRTLDGESVDVYVEKSTDGGSTWTEVAGPVARNDSIPVAAVDRVRFRVELSRQTVANNPTLDSIARRREI